MAGRTFRSASTQELKAYFSVCTLVSTNTWQCYLDRLDMMFYPAPPDGYKARLIVLLVCFGFILALTVTQLVLVETERRRNKQPYWLWRWVRIEGTPFLVTHQILITVYTALVAGIVNVVYIVFEWRMVFGHRSQRDRIARRSTIYFPMVLGGMLCSFSLLQAYVVVLSRKGRTWSKWTLRSCVVAYFLCIILFTSGIIVTAVIGNIGWGRLWSLYQTLRRDIDEFSPTWEPGTRPVMPASMYVRFGQLRHSAGLPYRTQTASKALYTTVAFINLTLASLCMGLWVMIRHQLSRHDESIRGVPAHRDPSAIPTDTTNDVFDLDDSRNLTRSAIHTTSRTKFLWSSTPCSEDGKPMSPPSSADQTNSPTLLTYSCPFSQPVKWQSAQDLRRAGSWVLLMGGFTMIASILFAGVLTWSSTVVILPFIVIPRSGRFSTEAEVINFLFLWVWVLLSIPFALTNTYQAWRLVASKKKVRTVRNDQALGPNVVRVMEGARTLGGTNVAESSAMARSVTHSSDGADDSLEAFLRSLEPRNEGVRKEAKDEESVAGDRRTQRVMLQMSK
ncbi:BQ5605_C040g11879 [Microbotryum silenes-dioicae]|uniref:BQ5605_C040g11879 protein n=1 Tax=Microbotryum silenes-dioicae TaxID=796604 RepID=A0A2X0NCB5_9BASI|nr:BQ5605_C040g11879 [Microbotryum silenes-dioicae]